MLPGWRGCPGGQPCGKPCRYDVADTQIKATVDGIMKALSSAQQSEVKAWEEEIIPCEHALTLEQVFLITPGEGMFAPSLTSAFS